MGLAVVLVVIFLIILGIVGFLWFKQSRDSSRNSFGGSGGSGGHSRHRAFGGGGGGGSDDSLKAMSSAFDSLKILNQLSGDSKSRTFTQADLQLLQAAFKAFQANPGSAAEDQYFQAMRHHYILDAEMAVQEAYFSRYADTVMDHLRQAPDLGKTKASTYLQYLWRDLQDSGSPALAKKGQALLGLLQKLGLPSSD
jgi:hypothetical protein